MKKIIFGILFIVFFVLHSVEIFDLNFFNEPRFDFYDFMELRRFQEESLNDTINEVNFFTGRILKEAESDIFVLAFLNYVMCDYASPVDYLFYEKSFGLNFQIIASNIKCDILSIQENTVIETDSMKIGIFSIYTPDFVVKNTINPDVEFEFNIFEIARQQAEILSKSTDLVIMLSNVTRDIDSDIVKDLPVDIVISFDYQKKTNGFLSNRITRFYSILTNNGSYGKLRVKYANGKITYNWMEKKLDLNDE